MARWIRVNLDWSSSDWLVVLSSEARLCWIEFLCHVKQNGSKGSVAKRHPLTLARKWGVGEESVSQMLRAAEADGAITVTEQDWIVEKWREYQGDDAERMRNWRAKNREKSDDSEPSVTVTKRNVARTIRDVTVDIDIDVDNDNKRKKATPSKEKPPFSPPTVPEVARYVAEEFGLNFRFAEDFIRKNEARGWVDSKGKPYQNWKLVVGTWARSIKPQERDLYVSKPKPDNSMVHR